MIWPGEAVEAAREGLHTGGAIIIPALFPFFVLSSLVVELGLSRYLGRALQGVMAPLFRVNGACSAALVLGLIGGYPVGARTAVELYQSGQCSRTEAQRLLAFCNNSGPAFILGVVGLGVFQSGRAGLLLLLTHGLSALAVGVLFRFYRHGEGPTDPLRLSPEFRAVNFGQALTRSVTGAASASLNICAFVACFSVVLRLLSLTGVSRHLAEWIAVPGRAFGMDRTLALGLLRGVVELSSGVTTLHSGSLSGRMATAAFLLGWSGLSVHCQVLALLNDSGLSPGTCLAGKLLHGGISVLMLHLLAPHLSVCPASLPGSSQVLCTPIPFPVLLLGLTAALTAAGWLKKRSGKGGKNVL